MIYAITASRNVFMQWLYTESIKRDDVVWVGRYEHLHGRAITTGDRYLKLHRWEHIPDEDLTRIEYKLRCFGATALDDWEFEV